MMTAEKHLAAILSAWNETDGYNISVEMNLALAEAEKDFDGVEEVDNDQVFLFSGEEHLDANFNFFNEGFEGKLSTNAKPTVIGRERSDGA